MMNSHIRKKGHGDGEHQGDEVDWVDSSEPGNEETSQPLLVHAVAVGVGEDETAQDKEETDGSAAMGFKI